MSTRKILLGIGMVIGSGAFLTGGGLLYLKITKQEPYVPLSVSKNECPSKLACSIYELTLRAHPDDFTVNTPLMKVVDNRVQVYVELSAVDEEVIGLLKEKGMEVELANDKLKKVQDKDADA